EREAIIRSEELARRITLERILSLRERENQIHRALLTTHSPQSPPAPRPRLAIRRHVPTLHCVPPRPRPHSAPPSPSPVASPGVGSYHLDMLDLEGVPRFLSMGRGPTTWDRDGDDSGDGLDAGGQRDEGWHAGVASRDSEREEQAEMSANGVVDNDDGRHNRESPSVPTLKAPPPSHAPTPLPLPPTARALTSTPLFFPSSSRDKPLPSILRTTTTPRDTAKAAESSSPSVDLPRTTPRSPHFAAPPPPLYSPPDAPTQQHHLPRTGITSPLVWDPIPTPPDGIDDSLHRGRGEPGRGAGGGAGKKWWGRVVVKLGRGDDRVVG
ncbi:hypothetical protein BDK51DRAFT_52748, partial [Blyttiomyces helicus]